MFGYKQPVRRDPAGDGHQQEEDENCAPMLLGQMFSHRVIPSKAA
jgi:hypothetical protein